MSYYRGSNTNYGYRYNRTYYKGTITDGTYTKVYSGTYHTSYIDNYYYTTECVITKKIWNIPTIYGHKFQFYESHTADPNKSYTYIHSFYGNSSAIDEEMYYYYHITSHYHKLTKSYYKYYYTHYYYTYANYKSYYGYYKYQYISGYTRYYGYYYYYTGPTSDTKYYYTRTYITK